MLLLTWISACSKSRATEVAAGRDRILLIVAVEGVGGVITDGDGGEAGAAWLNGGAVGAAVPTGVVQCSLQCSLRRGLGGHAPAPRRRSCRIGGGGRIRIHRHGIHC